MGIRICHAEILHNRDVPVQSWLPFWFRARREGSLEGPEHQARVVHASEFLPKYVIS